MTPRRWSLLRWSMGLGVLALLLIGFDTRAVLEQLASADLFLAALGIAGLVGMHLLAAATWRTLLHRLGGLVLPWRQTVTVYYAAQALGGVTPANLGGDAYRAYALRAAGHSASVSLWPVVVQRSTSYLALSLLAAAALVALWSVASPALGIVLVALGGSLLVVIGVVLLILTSGPRRAAQRLMRALANGWSGERGPGGGWELSSRPRVAGAVLIGLLLGLAFHGGSILLTHLLVLAVAPGPVSLPVIAAIAVARLALAVPLTPSGVGVQEGLLTLLFAGLGMAPTAALAAMLLSRCALVATGLAGTAAFMAGRRAPRAVRSRSDLTKPV